MLTWGWVGGNVKFPWLQSVAMFMFLRVKKHTKFSRLAALGVGTPLLSKHPPPNRIYPLPGPPRDPKRPPRPRPLSPLKETEEGREKLGCFLYIVHLRKRKSLQLKRGILQPTEWIFDGTAQLNAF